MGQARVSITLHLSLTYSICQTQWSSVEQLGWLTRTSLDALADIRYAHMLNLIGPSSQLHFTSLSQSSIPPLQKYLETTTPSSSSKAHLHTDPILTLVEKLGSTSARVCLLDPRAPKELAPEDGETFDIFLYGGILGKANPMLDKSQTYAR